MKKLFLSLVLLLCAGIAANAAPALIGDGVADDTAAIQALLDSGNPTIYLPPPKNFYSIRKALRIHSNQTLRLDPNTRVRLADNANDYLLVNADPAKGDKNIRIFGGIWDGNNLAQTCDYRNAGAYKIRTLGKYMGSIFYLFNVEHLHLEGLTLKDPELFGAHLAKVRKFTVKDIVFDYNLELINEDGIHIKGPSSEGFIQNLKGNTNDDMVALNADDQPFVEPSRGPITDIRIDGLYAQDGFTAVRLNSAGSPIKRVHISNVFGTFRCNVISFTHYNVHRGEPRLYEDITLDNIYVARQREADGKPEKSSRPTGERTESRLTPEEIAAGLRPWWESWRKHNPFLWIQDGVTVDNLVISNVARREWLPDTQPLLTIEKNARVRNLKLRDVLQVNNTSKPLSLIKNSGTVERLSLDHVILRDRSGKEAIRPIIGGGTVSETTGVFITEGTGK